MPPFFKENQMVAQSTPDLFRSYLLSQLPASVGDGTIPVVPGSIATGYSVDSDYANATVAAPIAFAVITTTAALTGLYEVTVNVSFGGAGAPAVTDANNMIFFVGANGKFTPLIPAVANAQSQQYRAVFRFNNQAALVKNGGNAATAAVNYSATIIATRLAA